jgi:hypothetical protein
MLGLAASGVVGLFHSSGFRTAPQAFCLCNREDIHENRGSEYALEYVLNNPFLFV